MGLVGQSLREGLFQPKEPRMTIPNYGMRLSADLDKWEFTIHLYSESDEELHPPHTIMIPDPEMMMTLMAGYETMTITHRRNPIAVPPDLFALLDSEIMRVHEDISSKESAR
jgi:hypothetical protein